MAHPQSVNPNIYIDPVTGEAMPYEYALAQGRIPEPEPDEPDPVEDVTPYLPDASGPIMGPAEFIPEGAPEMGPAEFLTDEEGQEIPPPPERVAGGESVPVTPQQRAIAAAEDRAAAPPEARTYPEPGPGVDMAAAAAQDEISAIRANALADRRAALGLANDATQAAHENRRQELKAEAEQKAEVEKRAQKAAADAEADYKEAEKKHAEFQFDPKRVFNNASVPGKIAMALTLALNGWFAAGRGGKNQALEVFFKLVDNDMASQRSELAKLRDEKESARRKLLEEPDRIRAEGESEWKGKALRYRAIGESIQKIAAQARTEEQRAVLDELFAGIKEKEVEARTKYMTDAFNKTVVSEQLQLQKLSALAKASKGTGGGQRGVGDANAVVRDVSRWVKQDLGRPITKDEIGRIVPVPFAVKGPDGKFQKRLGFVEPLGRSAKDRAELSEKYYVLKDVSRLSAELSREIAVVAGDGSIPFKEKVLNKFGLTAAGGRIQRKAKLLMLKLATHHGRGANFPKEEQAMIAALGAGDATEFLKLGVEGQRAQLLDTITEARRELDERFAIDSGIENAVLISPAEIETDIKEIKRVSAEKLKSQIDAAAKNPKEFRDLFEQMTKDVKRPVEEGSIEERSIGPLKMSNSNEVLIVSDLVNRAKKVDDLSAKAFIAAANGRMRQTARRWRQLAFVNSPTKTKRIGELLNTIKTTATTSNEFRRAVRELYVLARPPLKEVGSPESGFKQGEVKIGPDFKAK